MNRKLCFLTATAVLLSCLAACSREPTPIFVLFEFNAANVREKFPPAQRLELERGISTNLAKRCFEKMPFWRFQAGGATDVPQLHLFLKQGAELTFCSELVLDGGRKIALHNQTFFAPEEESQFGNPAAAEWPGLVEGRFMKRLLKERDPIFAGLRTNCPLIRTLIPLTNAVTQAALPLVRTNYKELVIADFQIRCVLTNGGASPLIRLYSRGIDLGPEHRDAEGPYRTIAVQHDFWEEAHQKMSISQHTNRLSELGVKGVYLLAIDEAWRDLFPSE